ncbi:hydroxyquinol 1,2-dioxygenase [Cupriavidus sp. WGlv3]|uniref:hydroxyquinol 1,2-dioxygenase n=1 Tax=Cupriavidus sp. WGlv3 TaxID=2919924 RepID=UPI0020916F3A|nr:hydroxyquinol 1,2-dioxygenase [Cupriavidus sp. WGlv3]MCO4860758.1 hydroxyquinol 1,2-dioxygenase [Cupriavidus sp. WGlv3]
MTTSMSRTVFGSLDNYRKGGIEVTQGDARHYVFSNVFEVAANSVPYERVVVGKNLEYVVEAARAQGQSAWFACSHDEFVISMDGEVRVDFVKLDAAPAAADGAALAEPVGRKMGHVVLGKGHQSLLPAGCAYRFSATKPCTLLVQSKLGVLSVQKWAQICLK